MCRQHNLLVEPCLAAAEKSYTLPGVLAALARDEIDSFTALRPHQAMFWHMFCVQLGALALYGKGTTDIPEDEDQWRGLLRAMTLQYPDDQPWSLVVEDTSKPAFMQPPVPEGLELKSGIATPDALDLLITSRNHDLKQTVARQATVEDWVFALVTLQTGEGYGGRDNHGIARMNGGSSSRPMQSLAPLCGDRSRNMHIRPGLWFRREVGILLRTRSPGAGEARLDFNETDGKALLWLDPWSHDTQLQIRELDPWFIEICRRVRLDSSLGNIVAVRGKSQLSRINAKALNGVVDDPWAPVHKTENKSLTLGGGDFDYRKTVELLFSGDWEIPLLGKFDKACDQGTLAVVFSALSRGNSKTEGLKLRIIPLSGKVTRELGPRRGELHDLAKQQVETIVCFAKALKYALVLVVARGERSNIKKIYYDYTGKSAKSLDRYADEIFFEHLWARFEAQDVGPEALHRQEIAFARKLWKRVQVIFDDALPTMPCSSLFRPRAEVRARRTLRSKDVYNRFPEVFNPKTTEEATANAG